MPAQATRLPARAPVFSINVLVYKGPIVDEMHTTYSNGYASQITRIYHGNSSLFDVEIEWLISPKIPIENDGLAKEIISKFEMESLKNDDTFYTDSNGRSIIERKFKINSDEPVSANYYPITSFISIEDDQSKFTIMTDRAQGGSSLKSGEIELMIHRRLINDDDLGLNQVLDDDSPARGKHYLLFDRISDGNKNRRYRLLGPKLLFEPLISFSSASSLTTLAENNNNFQNLNLNFPANVHLLSWEIISGGKHLIRLEHLFKDDEDSIYSQDVEINLSDLFDKVGSIESIMETDLKGVPESSRNDVGLQWNELSNEIPELIEDDFDEIDPNNPLITLKAFQIRTFVVTLVIQ